MRQEAVESLLRNHFAPLLGVERTEASRLLEASGGHVKTAIVMARLSLDAQEAQRRLDAVGGSIAELVGDLQSS